MFPLVLVLVFFKGTGGDATIVVHDLNRILRTAPYVGMTRARVIELLGEPDTVDTNPVRGMPEVDSQLVYRLRRGVGNLECAFQVGNGRVLLVYVRRPQ